MKTKKTILFLTLFTLIQTSAFAEVSNLDFEKDRRFQLNLSPAKALLGMLPFGLHYRLTDHFSLGAKVNLAFYYMKAFESTYSGLSLVSTTLEPAFWFGKKAFQSGWVLSPFATYSKEFGYNDSPLIGLTTYYQWTNHDGFSFAFGGGASAYFGKNNFSYAISRSKAVTVFPELVLRIGYAF